MKDIYRCRVCGRYVEDRVHCGVEAEFILDGRKRVMLSKLMSGLLRHYPWEAGLRISNDGWVYIDDLVEGIKYRWRNRELYQWVTREHVVAVATLDPKNRFEIMGERIRARYGHSIDVMIKYGETPVDTIDKLYHGTSRDRVARIIIEGLKPMKRKYVHLTIDPSDAIETGRRHGKPVLLLVDPRCIEKHGLRIYRATDKIYLVKYVPPECIRVLD